MARTDPQINVRLPLFLKEELEARAASNHRSFKAEVVARLENSLVHEDEDILHALETAEHLANPNTRGAMKQKIADAETSATRETKSEIIQPDLAMIFRKMLWMEREQQEMSQALNEILQVLNSKK